MISLFLYPELWNKSQLLAWGNMGKRQTSGFPSYKLTFILFYPEAIAIHRGNELTLASWLRPQRNSFTASWSACYLEMIRLVLFILRWDDEWDKTSAARARCCLRCEERVWYHSFQFHWPPVGVRLLHSWRDDGVWSSPPCCQSMHRVCPAINHDTHTSCPRIKPHYSEKSCIFTGGDLFIVSPQSLSSPEQQLEVWARPTHTMSQQCLSLLRWQDNRSCRCSWCI